MAYPQGVNTLHVAWGAFYNFCFAWALRQWATIDGETRAIASLTRYL